MSRLVLAPRHFFDAPPPGRFYMIKARPSAKLLGRPISLFHCSMQADGSLLLEFLILNKGEGTAELCSLLRGNEVDLLGPLGNSFPFPEKASTGITAPRLLFIGGGIGIAPPAGFAALLPDQSYDFIACFKSGCYGLDYIRAQRLITVTEDGSVGLTGRLPDVLSQDDLVGRYDLVYACGPEPMLAYVKHICDQAGVTAYLSVEQRMACATGACLGCTISTTEGNRRVCCEGPVFRSDTLIFHPKPQPKPAQSTEPDLSTELCGLCLSNPIIAASGTFGYGSEYAPLIEVGRLGALCSKGLTLEAREGNEGVRLCETPSGLMNSIGLQNPGINTFIEEELPRMIQFGPPVIANLSGSALEDYAAGAELLDKSPVSMIELNISCPNVKAGGMSFGLDCTAAASVTQAVRSKTTKPLMVKLSPNAASVTDIAHAVREAGADAISLVNTFQALDIDIENAKPRFVHIRAGLSGPAIRPLALRMVYDLALSMQSLPPASRIPIVGMGGIASWQDAAAFIMAGAQAIQVGTATFAQPNCMISILEGLALFMERKGYRSIEDFRGLALRQ